MKKISLTLALIVILVLLVGMIYQTFGSLPSGQLVGPNLITGLINPPATLTPQPSENIKAPKSFQFDANTDLNAELEKVDPQVLDSDFN